MKQETSDILRKPFDASVIGKKPKKNRKTGQVTYLDYVGHAAITDRLIQADTDWTWEPIGFDADGNPLMTADGGMWIRLTVDGVTRLGYGNAAASDYKDQGDRTKEVISDALRNAAMRFGVALDLWHKGGDLYKAEPDQVETITPEQVDELTAELNAGGSDIGKFTAYIAKTLKVDCLDNIPANAYQDVLAIAKRATAAKAAKAGA